MKAITNNYSKLLASGFLANAKQELRLAQTTLLSPLEDEYDDYEDFYWSFDLAARKTEFDFYFDELGVGKFVANRIDFFLKKKDAATALYTPDGYIYCGYSKKAVKEMANNNYQTLGLMPYYTTKRKIQGRMMWFCIAWNALLFNLPNYN